MFLLSFCGGAEARRGDISFASPGQLLRPRRAGRCRLTKRAVRPTDSPVLPGRAARRASGASPRAEAAQEGPLRAWGARPVPVQPGLRAVPVRPGLRAGRCGSRGGASGASGSQTPCWRGIRRGKGLRRIAAALRRSSPVIQTVNTPRRRGPAAWRPGSPSGWLASCASC
jgi:hypothetical protein